MNPTPGIKREHLQQTLLETDVEADAIIQFGKWWQDAFNCSIEEMNAFTLATATLEGKPSARIVLLKSYDENGFVFFTNYSSNKGNELTNNQRAAMVFFWKELQRQVRIEGIVEKVSSEESDSCFASMPEDSRISCWASSQSAVIESRELMEESVLKFQQKFEGQTIPRPKHWGGFRVRANLVEFWQGSSGHLHDRLQYTLQEAGGWKVERLAP